MTKRAIALTVALLAGGLLATTAHARPLPDGGVTGPEIAAVLQEKGYKAELTKDSTGDPLIKSAASGAGFQVFFYGCNAEKRCSSIQFSSGWDLDAGFDPVKMNEWNFKKRFGRGGLDDEKDPYVRMDIDLEHGANTEAVANNIDTWDAVLAAFKDFIGQ